MTTLMQSLHTLLRHRWRDESDARRTLPPEAILATSCHEPCTWLQPTWQPPVGCIAVTAASCDQTSAIGRASPFTMLVSAA